MRLWKSIFPLNSEYLKMLVDIGFEEISYLMFSEFVILLIY